ncbi:phosphoenolpyruvate--protein phosphotransferase [Thermoactinomyces sp. DSM 45892]|uniref:phosphoenolpyruvate--protein phosphotransferase n=1 Tax=Thermoactinomyces sp. DSM 45892 TaxID=1882753 RepID=UPI00089CD807|nr:phosphoenolpyruvate--protein phosphotransferase [Thermoactinomyces sp. DSM 45892]SDY14475.1 phosphoenolpyruvate--protein phosphotransferase [Thermoactinomyces sp. DSM 45892]
MEQNGKGIGAATGLAIGTAVIWKKEEVSVQERSITDLSSELQRFKQAIQTTKEQVQILRKQTADRMGESEAAIFDAHLAFLDDPGFIGEMEQRINTQKQAADWACQSVTGEFSSLFSNMEDEYMRARADDIRDVGNRLLQNILDKPPIDLGLLQPESIIIADELTPSETAQFSEAIIGMVTERGSKTAHAAIMARTLGIPAVLGLGSFIQQIHDGDTVILDGSSGEVIVNPNDRLLSQIKEKIAQQNELQASALQEASEDAYTSDRKRIEVLANIGSPQDVPDALANHAEGIGLFRTEFLYLENTKWPTEEEQYTSYKQVLEAFPSKPVIIRTLDIGGDKHLPYAELPKEENPFLGLRAVRYCLTNPDVFKTQLRALLRASVHGTLWIMFPMIGSVSEILQVKQILEECKQELTTKKIPYSNQIKVGIMVEIPAAAIHADELAKEVDFMSIGTNDLTQYTLAADRGNEQVAQLYDPTHPAVLKLVKMTCDACHRAGIPAGMCGELAGDTSMTEILVGLGLNELSMSAKAIPQVKQQIRKIESAEASSLALEALHKR